MTHEEIEKTIDAINSKTFSNLIFLSDLDDSVSYGRVWRNEPQGGIGNEGSYEYYFIRIEDDEYVGAVLDMGNDLHVFMKSEFRKRGILAAAMVNSILPYLFQQGRKHQRVTYKDEAIGTYVKNHWGFERAGEGTSLKDLSCYSENSPVMARRRAIERDELALMKRNLDKARLYLTMVAEHIQSACGVGNDAGVSEFANEVGQLDDQILNFIEEYVGPLEQ
jgi:hypothetical protein